MDTCQLARPTTKSRHNSKIYVHIKAQLATVLFQGRFLRLHVLLTFLFQDLADGLQALTPGQRVAFQASHGQFFLEGCADCHSKAYTDDSGIGAEAFGWVEGANARDPSKCSAVRQSTYVKDQLSLLQNPPCHNSAVDAQPWLVWGKKAVWLLTSFFASQHDSSPADSIFHNW